MTSAKHAVWHLKSSPDLQSGGVDCRVSPRAAEPVQVRALRIYAWFVC